MAEQQSTAVLKGGASGSGSSLPSTTTTMVLTKTTWEELEQKRPLPVHFRLFPSRRPNRTLCPALTAEKNGVVVIRILDPEHREPYVSLCSLFAMAGLSPIAGLLRFGLQRDRLDYDVTLAGLEPREALWASLKLASGIAKDLGLDGPLALLLSWDLRHAWTLDEGDAGLTHNWRVPSKHLDPGKYSTRALLASPWPALQLLPRGQQVRTLVSRSQRAEANSTLVGIIAAAEQPWPTQKTLATLELRLLRWAVRAHDAYLDVAERTDDDDSGDGGDDEEENGSMAVTGSDTETVKALVGLLQDMNSMLPSSPSATSDSVRELLSLPSKKGHRVEQGRNSSPAEESARVQLALAHHLWLHYRLVVDSLARPATAAPRDGLGADAETEPEPEPEPDPSQGPKVDMGGVDARLARIEQATNALLSLQEQQQQRPLQPPITAATASPQTWYQWRESTRQQQNILLAGIVIGLLLSRLLS